MNIEEVQEMIDLTPNQEKAWKSLKRAFTKCAKENIYLYQVLDSLSGLNGNNISKILEKAEVEDSKGWNDERNLQNLAYESVKTTDAWADDTHFVILK
jgi:hypothetical protein